MNLDITTTFGSSSIWGKLGRWLILFFIIGSIGVGLWHEDRLTRQQYRIDKQEYRLSCIEDMDNSIYRVSFYDWLSIWLKAHIKESSSTHHLFATAEVRPDGNCSIQLKGSFIESDKSAREWARTSVPLIEKRIRQQLIIWERQRYPIKADALEIDISPIE